MFFFLTHTDFDLTNLNKSLKMPYYVSPKQITQEF